MFQLPPVRLLDPASILYGLVGSTKLKPLVVFDLMPLRLPGDFNGWFGGLLCLSHDETCVAENGERITLAEGMLAEAFEPDVEAGEAVELFAIGTIERAPEWLSCRGSRWVLRANSDGLRRRALQPRDV